VEPISGETVTKTLLLKDEQKNLAKLFNRYALSVSVLNSGKV